MRATVLEVARWNLDMSLSSKDIDDYRYRSSDPIDGQHLPGKSA